MEKISGEIMSRPLIRYALILGMGSSVLSLVGCADTPDVLPGRPATVLEHEYHPPYSSIVLAGQVPVLLNYPAEYHLDVMQCDRLADDTADGTRDGCIVEHMPVSRETYEAYPDGAQITFEESK